MPSETSVSSCIYCGPSCNIPYGMCHCGCGKTTSIIQETYRPKGRIKGEPARFISGHNRSRLIVPFLEDAVPFKIEGVYCRLIPLTKGLYAIVDADDYGWLMQWKWFSSWNKCSKTYYAVRDEGKRNGNRKTVLMHVAIKGTEEKLEVDHKDHVGLNCTRLNLRPCTHSENLANTRLRKDNKVRIKGVQKQGKRFVARARKDGKVYRRGPFDSPEEAGAAYLEMAKELYGDFVYEKTA